MAFIVSWVGVILGIVALNQIKNTNEQGKGLATAAIIIGVVKFALIVVLVIAIMVFGVVAVSHKRNIQAHKQTLSESFENDPAVQSELVMVKDIQTLIQNKFVWMVYDDNASTVYSGVTTADYRQQHSLADFEAATNFIHSFHALPVVEFSKYKVEPKQSGDVEIVICEKPRTSSAPQAYSGKVSVQYEKQSWRISNFGFAKVDPKQLSTHSLCYQP